MMMWKSWRCSFCMMLFVTRKALQCAGLFVDIPRFFWVRLLLCCCATRDPLGRNCIVRLSKEQFRCFPIVQY